MGERTIAGCRVLLVEDEYLLAEDLSCDLADAGARVVGPVGTLDRALAAIASGEPLDGAVLDVNLRGQMAFPAAEALQARGVPFVFATGYDASAIPARFDRVPRCEKPVGLRQIAEVLGLAIGSCAATA